MSKRTILTCMLLLLTVHLSAQHDAMQRINRAATAIRTMQGDFVQTKQLKLLNDQMVSKGRMCYQGGDKLRWEYVTPYSYVFIMNGSQVQLKNSTRSDVIDVNQNKIFKEIAQIMMNSVVGKCLQDDKSFKTTIQETASEYVATLLPQKKNMKQMFQQIVLHFQKQQSVVSKVELLEKNGDRTMIELKNIRLNETIPAREFAVR